MAVSSTSDEEVFGVSGSATEDEAEVRRRSELDDALEEGAKVDGEDGGFGTPESKGLGCGE